MKWGLKLLSKMLAKCQVTSEHNSTIPINQPLASVVAHCKLLLPSHTSQSKSSISEDQSYKLIIKLHLKSREQCYLLLYLAKDMHSVYSVKEPGFHKW